MGGEGGPWPRSNLSFGNTNDVQGASYSSLRYVLCIVQAGFEAWEAGVELHARGGGWRVKKSKPSHWGLVLANESCGGSFWSGVDLSWVVELDLQGMGVVSKPACRWALLTWLAPSPPSFSTSFLASHPL